MEDAVRVLRQAHPGVVDRLLAKRVLEEEAEGESGGGEQKRACEHKRSQQRE